MSTLSYSDVNECEIVNGGCSHLCLNKPGTYECSCFDGYQLDSDKGKCTGNNGLYH